MGRRGIFVTFEGIDGCGKSTQIELARACIRRAGRPLLVTREPGGHPISEKIRSVVMGAENEGMSDGCELLLYLAARAQHVSGTILPALDQGTVVLCDRFQEATFAYQGYGRGLPLDRLRALNSFATQGLCPDLTFIFDISVETSLARLAGMGKQQDRLEKNPPAFFERVRRGYLEIAAASPGSVVVLQADRPVEAIAADVESRILRLL